MLAVPAAAEVAHRQDTELTREAGRITAVQLAALGFNLNFAPVLDVHSNPHNPIIGKRSFGTTPEIVSAHARAWAEGSLAGGVLPCGKHFPGHGDTDVDSHLALPVIHHEPAVLNGRELPPFRAAVQWGIPALMTAHVVYKSLDPQWPATLSSHVIPEVLRGQLGFEGTVISDDLEMAAIAKRHSPEEIAERGLAAGLDLFLVCRDLNFATEIRLALSRSASTAEAHIRGALRRLESLRRLGQDNAGRPWPGTLPAVSEGEELLERLSSAD